MQPYQALRPDSSVVERGPEKAGVGGSIPSLATTQLQATYPSVARRDGFPLSCTEPEKVGIRESDMFARALTCSDCIQWNRCPSSCARRSGDAHRRMVLPPGSFAPGGFTPDTETMRRFSRKMRLWVTVFLLAAGLPGWVPVACAQSAPAMPESQWHDRMESKLPVTPAAASADLKTACAAACTLPELINLAEQRNPATRLAWEQARARAASLGIARSEWYPTLAALALADTARVRVLLNSQFYRQTYGNFSPELHAEYLILDFGGREEAIGEAKWNLLAADLSFNDVHRRVIFLVMQAYYRLLNAVSLRQAAEVSLKNAKADEEDAGARLQHGLATKPDLLEAQAARAQAEFDLQAARGAEAIARGGLATALELPPETTLEVQQVDTLTVPTKLADTVRDETERALAERPDLKALAARMKAADAEIGRQRSTYLPTLSLSGDAGETRQYGQQDMLPPGYAGGETWDAALELRWTLFDGGRREHEVAQARAQKAATQAQIDALRDRIAEDVWNAYSNAQTALRQREAALALVRAASESYAATRESYNDGVRNILDVIAAQKALAQAQAEDVTARTQVLLQVADLAFQTGDLLAASGVRKQP